MADDVPPLVSCEWLEKNLSAPGVSVLDASYFLPNQKRNAREEYRQAHIPGAGFFDIDEVADHATSLPHMLPSVAQFAEAVGRLGIDNQAHVICTDSNFFMASARLWWTFRVFGHSRVSVLDGGIEKWKGEKRPLTDKATSPQAKTFRATFDPSLVKDLAQVKASLNKSGVQILDARSPGRFAGTEPEPRPGLRGGHIPGSRNLFFKSLIDEKIRCFKGVDETKSLYQSAEIDTAAPVITSCGTGVTAAILAFNLFRLGNRNAAVYDGSWTEWGGREDTPVAQGASS